MTLYYLDTEFDGFGGPLISLALVREDGESLYLVNEQMGYTPWVEENVVPHLYSCPVKPSACRRDNWGQLIAGFIRDDGTIPEIVADWPDDFIYLQRELITGPGEMVPTPQVVLFSLLRIDAWDAEPCAPDAIRHNAWWDAQQLRKVVSATIREAGKDPN